MEYWPHPDYLDSGRFKLQKSLKVGQKDYPEAFDKMVTVSVSNKVRLIRLG